MKSMMNRRAFISQAASGTGLLMCGGLKLMAETSDNPRLAAAGPVVETSGGKIRVKEILFPMVLAGARRRAPIHAHHGTRLHIRSCRYLEIDDRRGKERQALADKMSNAWVAFARTGNPNHKGLPNWPKFDLTQKPTMVFNNECKVINDPYAEEKAAIAAATAGRSGGRGGNAAE